MSGALRGKYRSLKRNIPISQSVSTLDRIARQQLRLEIHARNIYQLRLTNSGFTVFPDCPQAGRCHMKSAPLASEPRHSPAEFPTHLARLDSDYSPCFGVGAQGWTHPDRQRTVLARFDSLNRPRLALQVTRIRAVDPIKQLVDRDDVREAGFVNGEGTRRGAFGIRFLDTWLALQWIIERGKNLMSGVV